MPRKTHNLAEIELKTSQIMYPSIHYSREACLDSMMTTSNFEWIEGKLVPLYDAKEYKAIKKAVTKGTAPSVDEALWQYQLENARKEFANATSPRSGTIEELAERYREMTLEGRAIPMTYRLSGTGKEFYAPVIFQIPDNVHPDFLALCLEYLQNVLASKTDFTEKTILTKSDIKHHFGKSGNGLNEAELACRKALSYEISKMLAETDGKPWPPNKEEAEEEQKKWNDLYSPAARARRANEENTRSKECAAIIMSDLRTRKLIP